VTTRLVNRVYYKASQVYRRFFRPVSLGCRVLVVRDGQVLLVKHSYQHGWYLPGGTVERGETLKASAIRELREECGFVATDAVLERMYYSEIEGRSDHIALFRVDDYTDAPDKKSDPEIAAVGFFPIDSLPADTSPATRRRINEASNVVEPAERW
jgi:8-oxo-dGTP pyrophosphatase MutT (NUDIX family)